MLDLHGEHGRGDGTAGVVGEANGDVVAGADMGGQAPIWAVDLDLHDLQLMHLIRDDTQKVRPLHGAFSHGERCHQRPTEQRGKQPEQKRFRGH